MESKSWAELRARAHASPMHTGARALPLELIRRVVHRGRDWAVGLSVNH